MHRVEVVAARVLQAGSGDETSLEVHVGQHTEEANNFVRYAVGCRFGLKVRLLDPTLINAVRIVRDMIKTHPENDRSHRFRAFSCLHVQDLAIGIAVASGMPVKFRMGWFFK